MTIVNRSEVVGHPLAAMLANDGATVYSVDMDSIYVLENGKMHRPEDYAKLQGENVVGGRGRVVVQERVSTSELHGGDAHSPFTNGYGTPS